MSLTAIKFHFTTPLHIGTVRADYDKSEKMIHSDTLYSAIIWAWSVLGLEAEIPELVADGNFTISSLFPFYQGKKSKNEAIYFFPKPMGTIQGDGGDNHKAIKKISYLDSSLFSKLLKGENLNINDFTFLLDGKNEYLSNKEFKKKFIDKKVYPRVYVPRYGEINEETGEARDTEIYYIERLFFKEQSGLFCLAEFKDDMIKSKVMAALRFLQDEGLGTDKHVGNGLFELKDEVFKDFNDLDTLKNETNHAVSLSLFCPDNKEQLEGMLGEKSAFDTMKRGGWITEEGYLTYRKKSVYMFTEGSIFETDDSLKGKTVNLQPDNQYLPTDNPVTHPIYRVGRSLFLPIKIQE
jgi:CRISPR type III-A-associated RAMP protein Csm4